MRTSEQTNEISAALAKAQGKISNPNKDKENPHFKSTYADLASGINAIRSSLSEQAIAFVQAERMEGDLLFLDTRLTHASGQWIEGEYPVCKLPARPQEIMACLTYARRGSLFSLVGIAGDDDDGNEANRQEIPAKRVPTPPKPPATGMSQEESQLARDMLISALEMAVTEADLIDWQEMNKATIAKLMEVDRQAVRDAYGDHRQALKGKAAA